MSHDVLDRPAPQITLEAAMQIAREVFALEAEAHPLVAERDCNFELRTGTADRYARLPRPSRRLGAAPAHTSRWPR